VKKHSVSQAACHGGLLLSSIAGFTMESYT